MLLYVVYGDNTLWITLFLVSIDSDDTVDDPKGSRLSNARPRSQQLYILKVVNPQW